MIEKVTSDNIITQQPFLDEHRVILANICEDINLSPSFLYVTNILKCKTETVNKTEFLECSKNLQDEIDTLKPCAIIVCGKVPQKFFKKYINHKCIEMQSLNVLFKGKSGINKMKQCLKILRDIYIE